ncbi:hypothetical protein [uncultured Rhodoblastus sp.]|uniref:hypothetical protein n=1 Tax=uncultured Rhodoblastus sp. TaxID=543037 RepID=UPI0025FD7DB9|nr:hypothetical protein [uncultured Rhodoblastus sp.]
MTQSDLSLERSKPGERFADYCLWDYHPVAPPLGKLNSANLLWRAIEASGQGAHLIAACKALREGLGAGRTVYGVKKFGERLSFEFYFYDYGRLERRVSISRVAEILAPRTTLPLASLEKRPYFMFSLDLDEEIASRRRPLEVVNVYVGNPGSSVSSGICYEFTDAGLRLANFYFFFDARKEMDDIIAKTSCSAHHDLRSFPLSRILRPELLDCEVVVVANKKVNDGIYFSRIKIDTLIDFLDRERFPADLTGFVRRHRDNLDHMLYDVGVDYQVEGADVRVLKSAFYGLL